MFTCVLADLRQRLCGQMPSLMIYFLNSPTVRLQCQLNSAELYHYQVLKVNKKILLINLPPGRPVELRPAQTRAGPEIQFSITNYNLDVP